MHSSIRDAMPEDLEFLRSCAHAAYEKYVERIGQKPAPMIADLSSAVADGHVQLLIAEDTRAGFMVVYRENGHLFLENIAILPAFQNLGLGKFLLEECDRLARDLNLSTIELYTNEAMHENLALYDHMGFTEVEKKTENGFKRVYFRKSVSDQHQR